MSEEKLLIETVSKAGWLRASDSSLVALARVYAKRLDRNAEDFSDLVISATDASQAEYIRPHLSGALRLLGFDPQEQRKYVDVVQPGPGVWVQPGWPNLEEAVDHSLENMPWLTEFDQPLADTVRKYAYRIDYATQEFYNGEINSTQYNKSLYLGPHLMNVIGRIGGCPETRLEITKDLNPREADPIDELRKKRLERQNRRKPRLTAAEKRAAGQ